jgi:hypothetical protein
VYRGVFQDQCSRLQWLGVRRLPRTRLSDGDPGYSRRSRNSTGAGVVSVGAAICSQDETFTTLVILPFRQPSDEQLIALADALCANWTLRVIRRPSPTRPGACFQSALRLLQELSIPGRALPDTVLDALNRSFRANTTLRSVSIGGDNFGDAGLSRIVSGLSSSSSIEALPVHVLAVVGRLRKGQPYSFVYHCACSLSILRVVGSPLLVVEICCGCFETRRRSPVRLACASVPLRVSVIQPGLQPWGLQS